MSKFSVNKLISHLLNDYTVIAPVEKEGELKFLQINSPKEVSQSLRLPKNSFKQFLLPHEEVIFDFSDKPEKRETPKQARLASAHDSESRRVLFGIPIVDLKALILFDQVFSKDPFYQASRQNTVIIGQGTAPTDPKFLEIFEENVLEHLKFDIFIDRVSKKELKIFTGTRTGQRILDQMKFSDYEHTDYRGPVEGGKLDAKSQKLKEQMKKVIANKKFWEDFAKDCILCGKCTVACPTCYCFDWQDEGGEILKKQAGVRKRRLSSCFYEDFAQVASGENFLKTKGERLRNYYLHKFIRTPERLELLGCVGCLRCFQVCPVGIDIRKILAAVLNV